MISFIVYLDFLIALRIVINLDAIQESEYSNFNRFYAYITIIYASIWRTAVDVTYFELSGRINNEINCRLLI